MRRSKSMITPQQLRSNSKELMILVEEEESLFSLWRLLTLFFTDPLWRGLESGVGASGGGHKSNKKTSCIGWTEHELKTIGHLLEDRAREAREVDINKIVSQTSAYKGLRKDCILDHLAEQLIRQSAVEDLDHILLRFLRARSFKLTDAFTMLIESLQWRVKFRLDSLMLLGEKTILPSIMKQGTCILWKEDKEGNIVVYFRARQHDKRKQNPEEVYKFVAYSFEMIRHLKRKEDQLICAVVDLRSLTLSCMDMNVAQFAIKCLQSYYPESLGRILVMDAPMIFWGFWTLIKSLLDPVVANKIKFIKGCDLKNYIEQKNIPTGFPCGEDEFTFEYDDPAVERVDMDTVDVEIFKDPKEEYYVKEFLTLSALHKQHSQTMVERDILKEEMRKFYYDITVIPRYNSFYERIGVLKPMLVDAVDSSSESSSMLESDTSRVDWSRHSLNK